MLYCGMRTHRGGVNIKWGCGGIFGYSSKIIEACCKLVVTVSSRFGHSVSHHSDKILIIIYIITIVIVIIVNKRWNWQLL